MDPIIKRLIHDENESGFKFYSPVLQRVEPTEYKSE